MLHEYIFKYKLPSLYNVASVYVFRADHLLLNSQLVYFPLENTLSCYQHSLIAYSYLCMAEAAWLFPQALWRVLIQLTFR